MSIFQPFELLSNCLFATTNVWLGLVILVFTIFITVRVYKWRNARLVQFASQFPGPTAIPIIGNGLHFFDNGKDILRRLIEYESRYKSPYRIWFGSHLMVSISKPEDLEIVFSNSKLLGKPEIFTCMQHVQGDSIFTPSDTWKGNRKCLERSLSVNILQNYVAEFNEKISYIINSLKCKVGQPEFDLWNYLSYCTFDIVTKKSENGDLDSEKKTTVKYHDSMKIALQICINRITKPWLRVKFISNALYKNRMKQILKFSKRDIKNKITDMKGDVGRRINNAEEDFTQSAAVPPFASFLKIAYKLGQEPANENLTRDEIIDVISAGTKATSIINSFFLLMVAIHQDVQEKLYDELYEVFGDGDKEADANDMKRLIYLEQVLQETLRMFMLIPFIFREVNDDIKIGEYIYPAGTGIIIPTYAIHYNPEYYQNPWTFNPDNFNKDAVNSRHKLTFLPFSSGIHNCIGQAYAMLEMKLVLSTLLRNYKFNTSMKMKDVKLSMDFIITSKTGYKVSVMLRDRRLYTNKAVEESPARFADAVISQRSYSTDSALTDSKEVEFHSNLSSSWWDNNGQMASLQALNQVRVPFIRDGLINCGVLDKDVVHSRYSLNTIKILDIGCGGGILCEALAKLGADVTGIDPSTELINIAKSHAEINPNIASKITYINSSIEDYTKDVTNVFDAVVSSEVIEHVTDKENFLKHCIQTLKPGGSLFLTTPNKTFASWFFAIVLAESLGFVPKGIHEYSKFIRHDTLEEMLKSLGCHTQSVQGWTYNPFTNRCLWVNHKYLLYALHAIKPKSTE